MEVWVGRISHRHGTDFYVAKTEEGLFRQLAKYCREWWVDTEIDAEPPNDDPACVFVYFESPSVMDTETFEISTATLED